VQADMPDAALRRKRQIKGSHKSLHILPWLEAWPRFLSATSRSG